jgi:hypothetical protein
VVVAFLALREHVVSHHAKEALVKAVLATALVVCVTTPALADYYIVQEPTTKRCRIVEERPASPTVGVVIGGVGFGVRTEAEGRMRTIEECRESGATTGGGAVRTEERVIRERQ